MLSHEFPLPDLGRPRRTEDISWTLYQPLKDKTDEYRNLPYTDEERRFWTTTILSADLALARVNNGHDTLPFVTSVLTTGEAQPTRTALNQVIGKLLNAYPDASYAGFAHGVLSDTIEIYKNVSEDAKKRMLTVIIGGTEGAAKKTTKILTKLPDGAYEWPIIIAHDDVADTCAAIAAFVLTVLEHKYGTPYDAAFVAALNETFYNQPYAKHTALYDRLIDGMEAANVVAGILVYKNPAFAARLHLRTVAYRKDGISTQWAAIQSILSSHALEIPANVWAMGLGMDTGIDGAAVLAKIPYPIARDPALQPWLGNLAQSRLRIGSTVPGLIGLARYPNGNTRSDNPYMLEELTTWLGRVVTDRLNNYIAR